MASRISDSVPIARGGSKPNGARGNPVTLVRIVVARNIAVQPRDAVPLNRPYITKSPVTMPIRLNATWISRNRSVGIPQVMTTSSTIWSEQDELIICRNLSHYNRLGTLLKPQRRRVCFEHSGPPCPHAARPFREGEVACACL